ncbi:MAG: hypothetical protein ACREE0_04845 [Phenylobacterium sp.]
MRTPAVIASLVCWSLLAVAAAAQPAPHEVSPVTIYPAGGHPRVVATFPAAGEALPGGVLILTVTFDQEMSPATYDLTASPGGEPLPCLKTPRLLDDGKTFAWLCTTGFGKSYTLSLNAGATGGFANVADQRAQTSTLAFTTTMSTDGPRNVKEAVKQAKLKAFEIPIQETPGLPATH